MSMDGGEQLRQRLDFAPLHSRARTRRILVMRRGGDGDDDGDKQQFPEAHARSVMPAT